SQTHEGSSEDVSGALVILDGSTDVTANYDISYVEGSLEVTTGAVAITAASDSKIYDGTALTNSGSSITAGDLMEGHTYTATVTGSQTNVGSSENVASAAVILDGSTDVTADRKSGV